MHHKIALQLGNRTLTGSLIRQPKFFSMTDWHAVEKRTEGNGNSNDGDKSSQKFRAFPWEIWIVLSRTRIKSKSSKIYKPEYYQKFCPVNSSCSSSVRFWQF